MIQEALRQMPAPAGRSGTGQGEAFPLPDSGEASCPRPFTESAGSGLFEAGLTRENLQRAWKRVKANKGVAGSDGLSIEATALHLRTAWPSLRDQLAAGMYRPLPVRRVLIPKPGGGERELGIPTVTDRLIQQALLQILQPLLDPSFSDHSHGFRPGRSAHGAVLEAQSHVQSGRKVVVDVDLEKFFDRVNHDILIGRLKERISDDRFIRLIRAFLNSGIMDHGVVQERVRGTPQGGPLSPLLANVLLDEVDKELERRGHCFVRYADDCKVYVRSHRAGERVLSLLRGLYGRLHLTINEDKSAVTSALGRKFLGFEFWKSPEGTIKRGVSGKPLKTFRQRVRQLTRRSGGRSMAQVAKRLRVYVLGWKAYFRLAQTPKVFKRLEEWMRHRVRAIQLKHWKRGKTIYKALSAMGIKPEAARQVAANSRRWWRNSGLLLNSVLTLKWMDALRIPRLA